jgi:hypothetical protein
MAAGGAVIFSADEMRAGAAATASQSQGAVKGRVGSERSA